MHKYIARRICWWLGCRKGWPIDSAQWSTEHWTAQLAWSNMRYWFLHLSLSKRGEDMSESMGQSKWNWKPRTYCKKKHLFLLESLINQMKTTLVVAWHSSPPLQFCVLSYQQNHEKPYARLRWPLDFLNSNDGTIMISSLIICHRHIDANSCCRKREWLRYHWSAMTEARGPGQRAMNIHQDYSSGIVCDHTSCQS